MTVQCGVRGNAGYKQLTCTLAVGHEGQHQMHDAPATYTWPQTQEEAIDVAWKRVRSFIADELECRESSMMPPSDDDARYIESAKAALRATDQIGIYMGRLTAGYCDGCRRSNEQRREGGRSNG